MAEKRRKKISSDTVVTEVKRKNSKPITEKIRRERINKSLEELKSLILQAMNQDVSKYAKMEKADILDMAVKYIKRLQAEKQGQIQEPNQTQIARPRTTTRQKRMKTNPSRKPKPRCSLDLVLPPIPISAENPSVSIETCVAKDVDCNCGALALKSTQMENQNPDSMKSSNHDTSESPCQVSIEMARRTSIESPHHIATRSPNHVTMVTQNNVSIENLNEVATAVIQSKDSIQRLNQIAMETSYCVAIETLNGAVLDDEKCGHTYSLSSPIRSGPQSISSQETQNEHYAMTFNEHQFQNEKLSPMRVTPNHQTSNVRLPGMECFIKNFNTNNLFPIEKENGHYDAIQHHYNSRLMGFDDQQFPMTLWRPW